VTNQAKGKAAEGVAAAWLRGQGYEILAHNHMTRLGEVDLVAKDGETLCFVEVRSRATSTFGSPAQTVTRRKRQRIAKAATDWAVRHGGLDQDMRFDVVSVEWKGAWPQLQLIRGAFHVDGEAA
jgi:putative endonuclease